MKKGHLRYEDVDGENTTNRSQERWSTTSRPHVAIRGTGVAKNCLIQAILTRTREGKVMEKW